MKGHRLPVCLVLFLSCALRLSAQQAAGTPAAVPESPSAANAFAQASQASLPRLVKFSGTVKDTAGRPLMGITFALYKEQEGGAALWMETQNVKPDEKGNYTVLLGAESVHGVPEELFVSGEARWLGVQPERQAELPRVLLVSVPYALKAGDAETLGGLPPSAFLGASAQLGALAGQAQAAAPSVPVSTQSLVPQAASVGGSGTANFIPLWTNGTTQGNSLLFQKGSAVQFPATGTATALKGANSSALDLISSAFKSGGPASNQLFRWQAEPVGNNTANPSGTLNLLFAAGTGTPAETGLSVNSRGQITFASGQAFPTVTGNETVTGNVSASQLVSTVANGTAPLKVTSTTQVPNLNASLLGGLPASSFATLGANTFTGSQSIAGNGLNIVMGNVGCGTPTAGIQASNVAANCLNFALGIDGSQNSTYINRPFGGTIHFREGNNASDQMVINPGGRVGIGTATPTSRVEIIGQDGLALSGFEPFLTLHDSNVLGGIGGSHRIQSAHGDLTFFQGPFAIPPLGRLVFVPRMIIQGGTGNVGIGIVNPLGKLHAQNGATGASLGSENAIIGECNSASCAGVVGVASGAGSVGVQGTAVNGALAGSFSGTVQMNVLSILGGADVAERFEVNETASGITHKNRIKPGMIVSIDPRHPGSLTISNTAYDRRAAGVISGAGGVNPGMLMGQSGSVADGDQPVALAGRVYCWADSANGVISPGDLLTTSATPGHAMKVTNKHKAEGAIIGKALTGITQGKGLILILVTVR
jgi:hypothetical protein